MGKGKEKRYQSSLRNTTEYNVLLHRFDEIVEKIWPESVKPDMDVYKLEGTCAKISANPEQIDKLIVVSYRLMKYIRQLLAKKRLPYKEGLKFPHLYTALEHAVAYTTRGDGNLAIEADKLEAVSRAGFGWLKAMKRLGRAPLRSDFDSSAREPRKPTWHEWQKNKTIIKSKCYSCKEALASDDSDMLCDYCSGASKSYSKCGQCKMPCKPDEYFCDMCKVESNSKQISIIRRNTAIIDPDRLSPFGHIDRMYPTAKQQDWGDIMLPDNRLNKISE